MTADSPDSVYVTSGPCPQCTYVLPPLIKCAPNYFVDGFVVCSKCGTQVDLWKVASRFAATVQCAEGLLSLGARVTRFELAMRTGEYYKVDLAEYGIPRDARILFRSYQSDGRTPEMVFAIESHGNVPRLKILDQQLVLYCVPLGEGAVERSGGLHVRVIWVPCDDDFPWSYLVTAFQALADREFSPVLVFAQTAMEIALMPVVGQRLKKYAPPRAVSEMLNGRLTYSHVLNVILPFLCGELGIPQMPDPVRGALNRLRRLRNQLVHSGIPAKDLGYEDAALGLAAAMFGCEYLRYVEQKIKA